MPALVKYEARDDHQSERIDECRQYASAIGFSEATLLGQYYARKEQDPASVITLQKGRRARTRFGEAMGSLLGFGKTPDSPSPAR